MEIEKNVARLIETLKDNDEHVQVQATEMLEEIGEPAVPQLIDALDDEDKNVRKGSAKVLGLIGDVLVLNPY
jgi:HEAT repeat protein